MSILDPKLHTRRQNSYQTGSLDALRTYEFNLLQNGTLKLNTISPSILDGQSIQEIVSAAGQWKHPYIEPTSSVYFIDNLGRPVRISTREGVDSVAYEAVSSMSFNEKDRFSQAAENYISAQQMSFSRQKLSQGSCGIIGKLRKLLF